MIIYNTGNIQVFNQFICNFRLIVDNAYLKEGQEGLWKLGQVGLYVFEQPEIRWPRILMLEPEHFSSILNIWTRVRTLIILELSWVGFKAETKCSSAFFLFARFKYLKGFKRTLIWTRAQKFQSFKNVKMESNCTIDVKSVILNIQDTTYLAFWNGCFSPEVDFGEKIVLFLESHWPTVLDQSNASFL